jgi:hypothetical protein
MSEKVPAPTAIRSSIPAQILDMDRLSLAAKVLFGCIYAMALDHPKCFMSNDTLGARLKLERRQVKRLLKSLEDAKLIERTFAKHHRQEIRVLWQPGQVVIGARSKMSTSTGRGVKNVPGGVKNDTPPRVRASASGGLGLRAYQPSAAREDAAAGGVAVWDLLGRGEELGLKGIAESKVADAVAVFGDLAVAKALDEAERHAATSWGYVLTVLRRWKAEDALPKPKPKPKPQPAPPPSTVFQPPPDDRPLEPGEGLAMMAKLKRQLAEGAKP